MIKALGIIVIFILSFPTLADDKPLSDPAQEKIAHSLMKEIRCLVCQNQSIEDSNSDLAVDLRNIIRERISAGDSPDDVKKYLVARYGDWVLLQPPIRYDTYFLWGSPILILIVIIALVLMNRKKQSAPEVLTDDEKAKLDEILKGDKQ